MSRVVLLLWKFISSAAYVHCRAIVGSLLHQVNIQIWILFMVGRNNYRNYTYQGIISHEKRWEQPFVTTPPPTLKAPLLFSSTGTRLSRSYKPFRSQTPPSPPQLQEFPQPNLPFPAPSLGPIRNVRSHSDIPSPSPAIQLFRSNDPNPAAEHGLQGVEEQSEVVFFLFGFFFGEGRLEEAGVGL